MWGIIATWRMAFEGVQIATELLKNNEGAPKAIEEAIKQVENYEYYKSVGYGGLPNKEMQVELDAAYMDGDDFSVGGVCAIKDYANPISIAKQLSKNTVNQLLVGSGAELYAHKNGFERKNMLTKRAIIHYKNRLYAKEKELKAYDGHDTVGMVCIDSFNKVVSATSTSGLFMKHPGRVGDSPIIGSGFYCDSDIGGVTATGQGEDIMRGCLSYEIVRLMREGLHPQEACDKAVFELEDKLNLRRSTKVGQLAVVAMDKYGNFGASSNLDEFSFVVAKECMDPTIFVTKRDGYKTTYDIATKQWLDNYINTRTAPLEKLYEKSR